ncbi:MAG: hypothetical protein KUG77_24585 [Nannocystaceae bacterium]|nr:hypothetical protein [Nannocystaceae bacterium]
MHYPSMTWLRSLALCAIAVSILGAPLEARADCSGPSECICANGQLPAFVLDLDVPADADLSAPVELRVLGAYGEGADTLVGPEQLFTLQQPQTLTDFGIKPGERALVFLDVDAIALVARRLDEDGDLDCYAADALPAAEVAEMALREDCNRVANADVGPCDDTSSRLRCSVMGTGSGVSLCLLALLGFRRRRESPSREFDKRVCPPS